MPITLFEPLLAILIPLLIVLTARFWALPIIRWFNHLRYDLREVTRQVDEELNRDE